MIETVLLTGVSGYIGLHAAQQLLDAGFAVRGSVRSKSKEQRVRDTLTAAGSDLSKLSIVELDLTSDKGWDDATSDCDFVMHVASPYAIANPKSEDEMIAPAVQGTLLALEAAQKAGVKRVVLTSSLLALSGTRKTGTVTDQDWGDVNDTSLSTYAKGKILAEKAAWDFMAQVSGLEAMELVVINPGAVFGPPLGRDLSGQTLTVIDNMLRGKMPMLAKAELPMVDVRDVAGIHVQAMTHPKVAGKRLIVSHSNPQSFVEIAQILKDEGYKGPSTRIAPNFLLRFMSLFDREAQGMLGFLGMHIGADTSKTRELFGWTPIPFQKTILDTGRAVKVLQS